MSCGSLISLFNSRKDSFACVAFSVALVVEGVSLKLALALRLVAEPIGVVDLVALVFTSSAFEELEVISRIALK